MTEPSRPEYEVMLARDLGMEARDGTRLATDVWRPARNGEPLPGPFPAVLIRTPYDKSTKAAMEGSGEFWARHGYLGVIQDCRGRFASGGDFYLLADEGPDGYDAVEWVASLDFCDGNVGTHGTSYPGWVQNALALECPPHLRAMWVNQGGSNGNVTSLRHNGALELRWLTWAVSHGATSPQAQRDPALQRELVAHTERMGDWLRRLPWSEGDSPLANFPMYERWALDLLVHGDDGEYWREKRGLNFEPYYDQSAAVPTMYSGGWYDSYTRATTDNYVALAKRMDDQFLLMGSWTHGDVALDRQWAGEVDLGPAAPIAGNHAESRRHMHLRWFDHWLRGVENEFASGPAVRIFVMGGGSGELTEEGRLLHGGGWRDEEAWPLARAVARDFYLRSDGSLSVEAPAEELPSTFQFDPDDPLPTISANTSSLNEIMPTPPRVNLPTPITLMRVMTIQGGADQRTRDDLFGCQPPYGPLADRDDVLAFTGPPLDAGVEVTGPVEATLYLSSDVPDTDLFVMLLDLYPAGGDWPDGYSLNICDGIMRVRYREGMERPQLMQPGEVYAVRFHLYPTSNRFAAGHRMQVLVSSSSFPRFDVNPNTGEPIGRESSKRIATNTIHHSSEHASRITLPIVPE